MQAAEDPKRKAKHIKDLWATLKLLRVSPQDRGFGPAERQLVEDILSGAKPIHEKQRLGFEAPWSVWNRCCCLLVDNGQPACGVLRYPG